jgi:rubrerythrin
MSTLFNAGEIFEIAIQIEKNGVKFYNHAAKMAKLKASKEKFINLAKMEAEHADTFTALKNDLLKSEKESDIYDPYGELKLYLNAFAEGKIFDVNMDPVLLLGMDPLPGEVVKLAMDMEKDSIVFYLGIKEMMSESAGKNKIDTIIAEEMNHLRLLGEELATEKQR